MPPFGHSSRNTPLSRPGALLQTRVRIKYYAKKAVAAHLNDWIASAEPLVSPKVVLRQGVSSGVEVCAASFSSRHPMKALRTPNTATRANPEEDSKAQQSLAWTSSESRARERSTYGASCKRGVGQRRGPLILLLCFDEAAAPARPLLLAAAAVYIIHHTTEHAEPLPLVRERCRTSRQSP